jgi:predicted DNA-binding transcriptional regulator YafY
MDTLHAFYGNGCIGKIDGKPNKWYYISSLDKYAGEEVVSKETLSEGEIELLVDLISETKILNSESTLAMVDKLLRKLSLPAEKIEERIKEIRNEAWEKNPNNELVEKKQVIQSCIHNCTVSFEYEDDEIVALPIGWEHVDGRCLLKAKVGDEYRSFYLEKIQAPYPMDDFIDALEEDDEEAVTNNTALDYLFVNIPILKSAARERRGIKFNYLSYVVKNDRVVCEQEAKQVLPHSLVFNDGKYYLIGVDEDATDIDKIAYFRVDLIVDLECSEKSMNLSEWNKQVYDRIEKARLVDKHPFMQVGRVSKVIFLVLESELDRVRDAFGKNVKLKMTDKTRVVYAEPSARADREPVEKKLVEVTVQTTTEEAYRWALANADAVELIFPQPIRDRLGRIANPIYEIYTYTFDDKVRENVDRTLRDGIFGISSSVDEDLAFKTFAELKKRSKTGEIKKIAVLNANKDPEDYFGDFSNTYYLMISYSPKCKHVAWAHRLKNVQYLEIFQTQIEDVSWMKDMKSLISIDIEKSPICDLSIISEHKNIHSLHLANLNVSDIGFIENFSNLFSLKLVGCPIRDFSPLFKLKSHLKSLEIDKATAQKIDLEKLRAKHIGIDIKFDGEIDDLNFLY